jgi:hypothetical protein
MVGRKHPHDAARQALRAFGLTYPDAVLKRPWPEHLDLVVRKKTFAFMNVDGLPLKISCKLPRSRSNALEATFASPTSHGLGRSGWVSAVFESESEPPLALLKEWIDESYRSQAPKSLVAQLMQPAAKAPAKTILRHKATAATTSEPKKTATKKPRRKTASR